MAKLDRDLSHLEDNFRIKVDLFLKHCKQDGIKIFVTEGYRTKKRQEELYAQGRTNPGNIVTWTLSSEHCKGRAIDIAFKGKEIYPSDQTQRALVAAIAKLYEIDWGYTLRGKDKAHFQCNGVKITHNNGLIKQQYLVVPKEKLDNKIIEYNQTENSCFRYSPIGSISDLTNKRCTEKELRTLGNYLSERGFKKGNKGDLYKVSPMVCNRREIKKEDRINCFLIELNSKQFNDLLMNGYSISIVRKSLVSLFKDWVDGIFGGIYTEKTNNYHATRVKIINGKLCEINNRYGKTNISEYRNRAEHIKNGTIRQYGVVFIN